MSSNEGGAKVPAEPIESPLDHQGRIPISSEGASPSDPSPMHVIDAAAETDAAKTGGAEGGAEAGGAGAGGGGGGEGVKDEMVTPTVDTSLQGEMESMGFSANRCVRALHFTGSASIEAAVNWIMEHEEDPDIDTPLLVSKDAKPTQKLTPEEAKKKAEELVEKARLRNAEEEKRLEREREQARIRHGKEVLQAQEKLKDEERKRRIEERRREKEEEQRARQRILQKLEEDKRERRRKLGLPPEEEQPKKSEAGEAGETHKAAAAASAGPVKLNLPVRPVSKAEKMRTVLRTLKQHHKDDGAKVTRAFETTLKYVSNLGQNPDQDKFRRIRTTNAIFQERVGCYSESLEFLTLCGFEREAGSGSEESEFLAVPSGKVEVNVLQAAASELHSAITNPYFGVL